MIDDRSYIYIYNCYFITNLLQNIYWKMSVLEESYEASSMTIGKTKLNFLQSQKNRLQTITNELKQQLQLQRHINQQIIKGTSIQNNEIIYDYIQQNKILQQHYQRIKIENQQLTSNLLISQQLIDQNQIQFTASFKSYQEKIIQLRRAIQFKQTFIQNLQAKLKLSDEKFIVPSTNVTLLFFNQIQELKKIINTLTSSKRQLQFQNKNLKSKNQHLSKKINLLENLTLKSQVTYQEFKHYYNYDKKYRNSAPKKGVYVPLQERLKQLSVKKLNEIQATRQCTQYSSLQQVDASVKMLVYKNVMQIQKLKQQLSKVKASEKYQIKSNKILSQSYTKQQMKINELNVQLEYYKKSTQDLLKIISHKRQFINSRSLERSKEQQIINKIKAPQQISYLTQRKKYWTTVQSNIKIEKIKLLQIKKKYNHIYRSLSCAIDYRKFKVDEIDKYLNKKSHKKQKLKKQFEYTKQINDFSQIIDGPFEDDFSIIQSHNSKKSYSDWKKSKKNVMNLTVIEENIL